MQSDQEIGDAKLRLEINGYSYTQKIRMEHSGSGQMALSKRENMFSLSHKEDCLLPCEPIVRRIRSRLIVFSLCKPIREGLGVSGISNS